MGKRAIEVLAVPRREGTKAAASSAISDKDVSSPEDAAR
jgi:hypothetical protein